MKIKSAPSITSGSRTIIYCDIWPTVVGFLESIPAVRIHPVVDTRHCITGRLLLYLSWIFDRPSLPGSLGCGAQSQIHRGVQGRVVYETTDGFTRAFSFLFLLYL